MGKESLSASGEHQPLSLLETHGDVVVTLGGVSMPLKVWFNFCPIPHNQLDPEKIERAAQEFLEGRNPFAEKDQDSPD